MIRKFVFATAMAIGTVVSAQAAETLVPITTPGGTDLSQAVLPPPGIYGALIEIPYNRSQRLHGQDGNPVPAAVNLKFDIPITAAAFAYVYPFEVAGGHFLTSVVFSYFDLTSRSPIPVLNEHLSGLADTYSDVFYYAKNFGLAGVTPGKLPYLAYGLNIAGGLAVKVPTGQYSSNLPINIGSNLFLVIPNIGATYITGPNMSLGDATEVSFRAFYGVPFTNSATGYTTGNIFNLDFSASQVFGPLQIGAAGFYQEQLSNDTSAGGLPVASGGKYAYVSIGPVIQYTFPNGLIAKAKYDKMVYTRGTVEQDILVLSLLTKF